MTQSPTLVAERVTVRYGDHAALIDASLALHPGELVVVLGPNGAGKSSLVRALSGIVPLASGRVLLGGEPLTTLSRRAIATSLAVVPQRVDVALGFSVREVVAMGRAPFQGALLLASGDDHARVEDAIARCDLTKLADRRVDQLSGGEQRLVAIARAMAQGAPTLLLDEPAAHLDIRHAHAVFDLVRGEITRKKLACLAVLHDLNAAAQYADRVVLVAGGRIVADGKVPEVMTYRRLRDVFETELYVGVNELDGTRYFVPMRVRDAANGEG